MHYYFFIPNKSGIPIFGISIFTNSEKEADEILKEYLIGQGFMVTDAFLTLFEVESD